MCFLAWALYVTFDCILHVMLGLCYLVLFDIATFPFFGSVKDQ